MKWTKRVLLGVAALLAIAVFLPFLVPLDRFVPRIEQASSERLQEPVSIQGLRLALLPLPHLTLTGIKIGKTADLTVDSVELAPDLLALLGGTKVLRSVDVDGLVLTQKAIDRIPAWTRPGPAGAGENGPQISVRRLRLANATVKMDGASFGPFDARVNFAEQGEPEDAIVTTPDGKFSAHLTPGNGNYVFEIMAKSWTLPAGPALAFDELKIDGVATLGDANLSQISAKLYGGAFQGKAVVAWRKRLQLSGSFDVRQVELKQVAPLFSPKTHVSGRLDAKPEFSASAAEAGHLLDALRLETPFSVQNGVIHGVDIQKAATNLINRGASGGETRFDQLSGHLNMEHGGFHFTQLKISSGALAVEGEVNVSRSKDLSGRINAQVHALGASTGVPLNVGGTVDLPLLYPTGGTLSGAAIGTALMGPGVGTTVGAKAGSFVEGLFSRKEQPKQQPKQKK